jgi:hypothetical protein
MKQRGRKSAAAMAMQSVIVPIATRPLPAPNPDGRAPDADALFDDLLRSVPRDHFAKWDLPLLRTYAGALVVAREAEARAATDPQALKRWEAAARVCSQLAGKLRVCPSARLEARTAMRRLGDAPQSYYDVMRSRDGQA